MARSVVCDTVGFGGAGGVVILGETAAGMVVDWGAAGRPLNPQELAPVPGFVHPQVSYVRPDALRRIAVSLSLFQM